MATIDSLVETTIVGDNDLLLIDQGGEGKKLKKGNLKIDADNVPNANGGSVQDFIDALSVSSIKNLSNVQKINDRQYLVKGFYADSDLGGGLFYYDVAKSKAEHNGGTVIAPDAIAEWGGNYSDLTNLLNWSGTGYGCFIRKDDGAGVIQAETFGLMPYLEDAAESNHLALKAAHKFAISYNRPEVLSGKILGSKKITFGAGVYYFKGHRPFNFLHTEKLTMGAGRYTSGMMFEGAGKRATTLIFKNAGSETWLFDNRDPNFTPDGYGTYDHLTFSNMALHSYDYKWPQTPRKHKVSSNLTINGLYMDSFGWEKMFNFTNVLFNGFDGLFKFRGNGNVDQHTWVGCQFIGIIDYIFDVSNDQSVANRLFGCDAQVYGDVIKIWENGGGDITWVGGSITQYPYHNPDNLVDNTLASLNKRGFLHANLEDRSSGVSLAAVNGNFNFKGLRFENYDAYQYTVLSRRDTFESYGSVKATFDDCTFAVDRIVANGAADSGGSTQRNVARDIVLIDKQNSDLEFNRCYFTQYQNFKVRDVGSSAAVSPASIANTGGYAQIVLNACGGLWVHANFGPWKDRFIKEKTIAESLCQASFVLDKCFTLPDTTSGGHLSAEDFSSTDERGGVSLNNMTWVNIKISPRPWPEGSTSGNRIYLPAGSVVTSIFIDKKAGSVNPAGSASYRLALYRQGNSLVYQTPLFQESSAYILKADLPTPFIVPDYPNNYLMLWGANGTSGVDRGAGKCLVGYF